MRAAATSPDSFQLWSTIWYRVRISDARGLFEGTRPEPVPKAHLSLALHSHVCPLLWCGLTRESRIPCARIAARRSSGGSDCLGRPLLWFGSPRESRLSPGAPDPRGAGSRSLCFSRARFGFSGGFLDARACVWASVGDLPGSRPENVRGPPASRSRERAFSGAPEIPRGDARREKLYRDGRDRKERVASQG